MTQRSSRNIPPLFSSRCLIQVDQLCVARPHCTYLSSNRPGKLDGSRGDPARNKMQVGVWTFVIRTRGRSLSGQTSAFRVQGSKLNLRPDAFDPCAYVTSISRSRFVSSSNHFPLPLIRLSCQAARCRTVFGSRSRSFPHENYPVLSRHEAMRVLRLGVGFVCTVTLWAIAPIDPRLNTDYRPGWTITPQMIQGDDYLKNIYIRSDLIEDPKESGVRLELAITLLDSVSCAPLENALVEIWGPDPHGVYPEEKANPQDCRNSSSRRGAIETNPEGVARFVTIFPGSQAGRPPHVNAIIRTDWFEHNLNRTLDSDASWAVASVGQIFFPDHINSQVLNQSDYQTSFGGSVANFNDLIFKAQSEVWQAQAGMISTDIKYGIRAQISLPIASNPSTSLKLAPAPYLCSNPDTDRFQSSTSCSSKLSVFQNSRIGFASIFLLIPIISFSLS